MQQPDANGSWTVISGSGIIANPTLANSPVSNFQLEQTLSAGQFLADYVQMLLMKFQSLLKNHPTTAFAGDDQTICTTTATLAGNTPTIGTGTWTVISGSGTFS